MEIIKIKDTIELMEYIDKYNVLYTLKMEPVRITNFEQLILQMYHFKQQNIEDKFMLIVSENKDVMKKCVSPDNIARCTLNQVIISLENELKLSNVVLEKNHTFYKEVLFNLTNLLDKYGKIKYETVEHLYTLDCTALVDEIFK